MVSKVSVFFPPVVTLIPFLGSKIFAAKFCRYIHRILNTNDSHYERDAFFATICQDKITETNVIRQKKKLGIGLE